MFTEIAKSVNVLDAVYLINVLFNDLRKNTISNSFRKSGFLTDLADKKSVNYIKYLKKYQK